MRFKPFFLIVATALVLAASSVIATAQMTQISGRVTLKQADGSEAPVAGAQIDIYRTDIKWETHIKTGKKGEYMHAGIPFVGTYTIIVSAPGARPNFLTDIRFSQRPVNDFTLDPGDGSRPTLEQLKAMGAALAGGGNKGGATTAPVESKEAKAAREELERKSREIEEGNKKITESNEIVSRTFKAGNDALAATPPRFDEAVTQFREGLAARPDEAALLINLSEALRRRGVDRFNAAIKSTDNDVKLQGLDVAKKDWTDAAQAASKAVEIISKAAPTGENANQSSFAQNKIAAINTRALAMRLVATKVDQSQAQAALTANQAMIEAEIDPAKKAKLKGETLQMLFDAGAADLAMAESQKVLTEDPDNPDANRIMGLALYSTGDKTKYQQAANHLQHYVDKAPDTDPLKASTKDALDYLKTAENIKPEKSQPARTGGRRRP
ncbi:MAG TPA: carboxypeptidase regulatory-like domain-containing protein [Pyrinomonadaceae bacterium]|nr:carboxypeptidase regulatory-like domain-containing protein [Pyrinomonadaceae bacterium]